jgi:adenine deaminase
MVTINPATYLGLDGDIGGIAPGRFADLQLVEDINKPFPKLVLVDGKIVAQDGIILVDLPQFPSTSILDWRQLRIPRVPVRNSDFNLQVEQQANQQIPCIHMVNKTITKEGSVTLPVHNGLADISPIPGLLKISLWSAHKNGWMTGLLTGFGAVIGGIASSLAHELHAPMVVGCNEEDMALAANRMLAIGGGVVIVHHGQVVGELPLVVGGTLSNASVREVAEGWNKLNHYLQEHGCPWDDPLFGLGFLSFTGLPYVRITPSGIVDLRKKKLIFS